MKTVFLICDILQGVSMLNSQYLQKYIRYDNDVCCFGKVDKFSFIFLQTFGYSGNQKVYRRDYLA